MPHTPGLRGLSRALRLAIEASRRGWTATEAVERDAERRLRSRREFLRTAGLAAAGGAVLAGCGAGDGSAGAAGVRVAVVGAGMAGLHCAYRLRQAGVIADVYEAADRLGGRMFTNRTSLPDGLICEMGGELIDTGHVTMHALAEEFGIALDDLFAGYPDDPGFEADSWFWNGGPVDEAAVVEQFIPLAELMAQTVALAESDDAYFAEVDNMSMKAWLAQAAPDHEMIRTLLDVAYNIEYGLETEEQSPFNLLYLIDYETPDPFHVFGDSDERFHTHLGNDTFIARLAEAVGAQIQTGARLAAVTDSALGGYRLTFLIGGAVRERVYDHVVFALPMTKLREVELNVELSDLKRTIIAELGYGSNTKLMGAFASKVWREHGYSGSLTSDNGLQSTWDTGRGQDSSLGLLTIYNGGHIGWDVGRGTPDERLREFLPALDQVFPGAQAAYLPGTAVRMFWPAAPWVEASYTCYRPGQWAFWGYEGQREGNLHFCGEHTSLENQGYMEGAAETGALVAAEILEDLGIAAPEALRRALGPKLAVPQSCYRGRRMRGLRFAGRKRLIARMGR